MTIEEMEALAESEEAATRALALTPEQQRRVDAQQRIDKTRAERLEAKRSLLALALVDREAAAKAALGTGVPVSSLMDDSAENSFVLRYAGSRAYSTWDRANLMSHMGTKDPKSNRAIDPAANNKTFALELVYEWNGEIIEPKSEKFARLSKMFDEFGGMASAIVLEGRTLSRAAMEGRKSGS